MYKLSQPHADIHITRTAFLAIDLKSEMWNSIWYIPFIAGRKKCSIHCYRHCRPRNETFAFHRSEIAYFMYLPQSPSNNVDVRMRNPYANFASFQTGKRAVKKNLHFSIHPGFRFQLSSSVSDRLLYTLRRYRMCNTRKKKITQSTLNLILHHYTVH